MLPDLTALLTYRNPGVIQKFREEHPCDEERADNLFKDVLKFLWASQKHARDRVARPHDESLRFSFGLHEEMRELDAMWHCFILFTEDYTDFCRENFGRYLHHRPTEQWGSQLTDEELRVELERYLSYLLEIVGPESLGRWFADGETRPTSA